MPASTPAAEWALGCQSAEGFEFEQSKLGLIWTFVGLASDLENDNDWFRASLGGRSIFVQRFGSEIRGFENRCAHRFYPLRTSDRGNGAIVCGFHHWRYNKEGQAIGIPDCEHAYGTIPRNLGQKIEQLDVDTCGNLVFARFRSTEHAHEDLRTFLGDGFAIVAKLSDASQPRQAMVQSVAANWKLCFQITLDDYHLVAVHPSTFGKGGYLPAATLNYARFGRHSSFFAEPGAESPRAMAQRLEEPGYCPTGYRIFQIFPNLVVSHSSAPGPFGTTLRSVLITQYVPLAHDRSQVRAWLLRSPYQAPPAGAKQKLLSLTQPIIDLMSRRLVMQIFNEDNEVCETLQRHAQTIGAAPLLGAPERRVEWFEETYAAAVGTAWRRTDKSQDAAIKASAEA